MRSRAGRQLVTGAVAAVVCVFAVWTLVAAAESAAKPSRGSVGAECREVKLISARGSGDPAKYVGAIGSKISGALARKARQAGVEYEAYGLPYTAVGIDWRKLTAPALTAALMAQYQLSKNEGRDQLHAFIKRQVDDCPTQKLVLIGFSQGAHVVGDVLSKGVGDLSPAEASRIKAVAVIADPRFNAKESFATGRDLRPGHDGLLGARTPGDLNIVKGRIRSWCRRNDIVCQGLPGTPDSHSQADYYRDYGEDIVAFIAGKLGWQSSSGRAQLVFSSRRDGNSEIYVMKADGSGQKNLTRSPAKDQFARWAPTGGKIAFIRGDADRQIHTMNPDGSSLRSVATVVVDDEFSWSPVRQTVALACRVSVGTYDRELCVVNADGSGLLQLTQNDAHESSPAWSPDGKAIVFTSNLRGLHVIGADGTGERPLTNGHYDTSAHWSPDGRWIAFTRYRPGRSEVLVTDARGGSMRRLTTGGNDYVEGWSPDGNKILFVRDRESRGGDIDIYVMDADGTGLRNLTRHKARDFAAVWSPDGRQIAFVSTRSGNSDIWVMNADGSGKRRLTTTRAGDFGPSWSP